MVPMPQVQIQCDKKGQVRFDCTVDQVSADELKKINLFKLQHSNWNIVLNVCFLCVCMYVCVLGWWGGRGVTVMLFKVASCSNVNS